MEVIVRLRPLKWTDLTPKQQRALSADESRELTVLLTRAQFLAQ
jgi:hypothetical protein